MINLIKALTMMMNSVEKMKKEREQKLAHLKNQESKFWSDIARPAISNLIEAIEELNKGRRANLKSCRKDDPIRILRIRKDDDSNWEFSFEIEIIREDLNLWVKLGEDEEEDKKYPLEEVKEDKIYQVFIEQYKKELINKLVPK